MSGRSYGQPSKIVHINIIWSAVSKRRSRANARLERMQLVFCMITKYRNGAMSKAGASLRAAIKDRPVVRIVWSAVCPAN